MKQRRSKSTGPNAAVLSWIRSIMRRRDWTATDLARRSALAPSTLLRALNDPEHQFVFSLRTLQKIAMGAEEPIPPHLGGPGPEMENDDFVVAMGEKAGRGYRMLGIRNVSALPAKARSQARAGKLDMIAAPAHLDDDESAFAFRNPDETLSPWFKPRAIMFATQARDPNGGDLVMLTGKDGRTRVRLLLAIDETGLTLSKSMPAKEDERMKFDDIEEAAVIVAVVTG